MRIVRSHDGAELELGPSELPNNAALEALHAALSTASGIPVDVLIAMHPSGRQVDRESMHALVAALHNPQQPPTPSPSTSQQPAYSAPESTVYLFDRELLETDFASDAGKELLLHLYVEPDDVLGDVAQDRRPLSSTLSCHS